jgi:hypothetical protein
MITQIKDVGAGFLGAIRSLCGLYALRFWLFWRRRNGKQIDLTSAWRVVMRFRFLFRGRAYFSNPFRDNWRHFAMIKLMRQLNALGCDDVPQIKVKGDEILTALTQKSQRGIILISPHSHLLPAIDLYAETRNVSLCGIADYSGRDHELFGLNTVENAVPAGAYTLLEARRKIGEGVSIYACPDFWRRREPTLYHDILVSLGLFELAATTNIPMLFVISQMDDDGVVWLRFERPDAFVKQSDSNALANSFIAFCERSAPQLAGMRIGNQRDPSRTVNELKNFCIMTRAQRRSMI